MRVLAVVLLLLTALSRPLMAEGPATSRASVRLLPRPVEIAATASWSALPTLGGATGDVRFTVGAAGRDNPSALTVQATPFAGEALLTTQDGASLVLGQQPKRAAWQRTGTGIVNSRLEVRSAAPVRTTVTATVTSGP